METLADLISYYKRMGAGRDQTALISLLREAQELRGTLRPDDLDLIGEILGQKRSYLLAVMKRIPDLKRADYEHVLTLCSGKNCAKSAALRQFIEKELGVLPGEIYGGKWLVQTSGCMHHCGKGPNFKVDGKIHHHGNPADLKRELGL